MCPSRGLLLSRGPLWPLPTELGQPQHLLHGRRSCALDVGRPLVRDDTARTEEHATFVKDLCALPTVVGAVVVPRPRKMILASSTDPVMGA